MKSPSGYYVRLNNIADVKTLQTLVRALGDDIESGKYDDLTWIYHDDPKRIIFTTYSSNAKQWGLFYPDHVDLQVKVEVDSVADMICCLVGKPFKLKKKTWIICCTKLTWHEHPQNGLLAVDNSGHSSTIPVSTMQEIVAEGKRLGITWIIG